MTFVTVKELEKRPKLYTF